jgi:hypothetical protein
MTRPNSLRLGRMFAVLAGMILLFVCTMSNVAHAQTPPPCPDFWVDTDIPGIRVNLNWTPLGTTPTSVLPIIGSNYYTTAPGPAILNSWSVTFPLPCGATLGPFNGPWGDAPSSPGFCVPDPCNPGQCIYIRTYMLGGAPNLCPYEIHIFRGNPNTCPGGCK